MSDHAKLERLASAADGSRGVDHPDAELEVGLVTIFVAIIGYGIVSVVLAARSWRT